MKNSLKRITAVIAVLASSAAILSSCGRDLGNTTSPDGQNAPPTETILVTMDISMYSEFLSNFGDSLGLGTTVSGQTPTQAQTQQTPQPATVPQETGAQQQTPAQQPTQNSAESKSVLNYSKDELLSYFNTSVNKIKSDAPAFTKEKQNNITDIKLSNSMANSLVSIVKGALLSDDVETTPVQKGQNCNNIVSREGQTYVSSLTPSDIKDITVQAEGSGYKITVSLPELTNTTTDGPYGKIFQFLTVDDVVSVYAPKVGATVARENISMHYSSATATVTTDADGKVINYETNLIGEMTLKNASIKKGVTINTDVVATITSVTKYSGFTW